MGIFIKRQENNILVIKIIELLQFTICRVSNVYYNYLTDSRVCLIENEKYIVQSQIVDGILCIIL